jgi:electron transport complex protein RnfB
LRPLANAVAVIDEERCIGCTLCIQACPVDAIVGATRLMHTVIAASCTGCELCVPPCPVDCIAVVNIMPRDRTELEAATAQAHRRYAARTARLENIRHEKAAQAAAQREQHALRRKQATIARALERARLRLAKLKQR